MFFSNLFFFGKKVLEVSLTCSLRGRQDPMQWRRVASPASREWQVAHVWPRVRAKRVRGAVHWPRELWSTWGRQEPWASHRGHGSGHRHGRTCHVGLGLRHMGLGPWPLQVMVIQLQAHVGSGTGELQVWAWCSIRTMVGGHKPARLARERLGTVRREGQLGTSWRRKKKKGKEKERKRKKKTKRRFAN